VAVEGGTGLHAIFRFRDFLNLFPWMILLGARTRLVIKTSRCAEAVAFSITKSIGFTASQAIFSHWARSFFVSGLEVRFTLGCFGDD